MRRGLGRVGKAAGTASPSGKSAGHPESGAGGQGRGRDGRVGPSPAAAIRQVARKLEFSSMAQQDMKKAFTHLKDLNKSEQETASPWRSSRFR